MPPPSPPSPPSPVSPDLAPNDSASPASQDDARHRALLIRARLERLPATRYIWSLVLLLSLGGWFEYYDLFFTAYIGPGLVRSGLSPAPRLFWVLTAWLVLSLLRSQDFSSARWFLVYGGSFGRHLIFTYFAAVVYRCTVVMAFQHSAEGIVLWRLIAGIGIGVELVTIDTYITELMPKSLRGRAFALNQTVRFTAVPSVALLSWLLVPVNLSASTVGVGSCCLVRWVLFSCGSFEGHAGKSPLADRAGKFARLKGLPPPWRGSRDREVNWRAERICHASSAPSRLLLPSPPEISG